MSDADDDYDDYAEYSYMFGDSRARPSREHLRRFARDVDLNGKALAWTTEKQVEAIGTPSLVGLLRSDLSRLYRLTPDQFEELVCERLDKMDFAVTKLGSAFMRDGGVDIVACSKTPTAFPFLVAVQVKHHRRAEGKTSSGPVKELQAVVLAQSFNAGLIVTNTTFTPDAVWFARLLPNVVRLRDLSDLKRWIFDEFVANEDWRDIPTAIELRPGLIVRVPGRRLT